MRSYVVTRGASKARRITDCVKFYRWMKAFAHRANRREWKQYLVVYGAVGGDERAEVKLDKPRLTGHDVI